MSIFKIKSNALKNSIVINSWLLNIIRLNYLAID